MILQVQPKWPNHFLKGISERLPVMEDELEKSVGSERKEFLMFLINTYFIS